MKFRNPNVSMGGTVKIEEYLNDVTDPAKISAAIRALQ